MQEKVGRGRKEGNGEGQEEEEKRKEQEEAGMGRKMQEKEGRIRNCWSLRRYRRRKQSCPSCHFSWSEERRDEEMTLRKVGMGTGARGECEIQACPGMGLRGENPGASLKSGSFGNGGWIW